MHTPNSKSLERAWSWGIVDRTKEYYFIILLFRNNMCHCLSVWDVLIARWAIDISQFSNHSELHWWDFKGRNRTVCRLYISHTLKSTANQRPVLPLHILRYLTGNMQSVIFHSTFLSLLARNSLLGSIWGLLKSQLQNSSTPANHYKHFRSRPEIFWRFPNISKDFWTFLKISKDLPKILKHKNIWKLLLNSFSQVFRKFPKISEDFQHFRRFQKIFWKFWRFL